MSNKVYTEAELMAEKPKGDVTLRYGNGETWKVFCCHGCQTCLYVKDVDTMDLGVHYPHFLSGQKIHEAGR